MMPDLEQIPVSEINKELGHLGDTQVHFSKNEFPTEKNIELKDEAIRIRKLMTRPFILPDTRTVQQEKSMMRTPQNRRLLDISAPVSRPKKARVGSHIEADSIQFSTVSFLIFNPFTSIFLSLK